MTTLDTGITMQQDVLGAARRLAPAIAARADEVEAGRRLPRDLLDELIAAGVFRLVRPATHGGVGADLPGAMRVFEALARADASVGWTAMIGSGSWCDLASLPRASFDELFSGAPDVITAGVFSPSGSIAVDGDGYRVTGRWSFASGCEHADWIYGNCIEGIVDGVPRLRIAVFSPGQVVIEDTWTVSGLCGTGSHHFHVDSVLVPAELTLNPMADPPSVDAPIVRVPPPSLFALAVAGVALGAAQGAMDDIVAVAADKVPLLRSRPLGTSPTFQLELATADTELRAARALIYETAEAAWEAAVAATELTLPDRARIRAAAAWATERAADVVRAAYRAGGGGSIYAASPLQRRLRDIDALSQHFLVRRDTLTTAGAILAGQDVDVMVF
ncbi:MAG TPA: acyl-CoA dehydrogenase family protein [Miltoncostaeaceae bacterium]|nr:acyl-CoA dehydrogenase family protein [Miltoncostaeaceae bacterium]